MSLPLDAAVRASDRPYGDSSTDSQNSGDPPRIPPPCAWCGHTRDQHRFRPGGRVDVCRVSTCWCYQYRTVAYPGKRTETPTYVEVDREAPAAHLPPEARGRTREEPSTPLVSRSAPADGTYRYVPLDQCMACGHRYLQHTWKSRGIRSCRYKTCACVRFTALKPSPGAA